jgi:N-methylhydantoinase A
MTGMVMERRRVRGRYVLGVDIGGTCTDVTLVDVDSNEQFFFKTESTPKGVESGVINAVRGILAECDRRPADCVAFVHGATLALNAILTRTGARLGLFVTEGFGDLLEMGRLQMPDPFNLYTQKPEPLIRRQYVAEVRERIDGDGEVLVPLGETELIEQASRLVAKGVEAVAICFINAYRNPEHERVAAALIRRRFPALEISLSSAIWPEIREYERAMVTVMNAYVAPRVAAYLSSLQNRLDALELPAPLNVTTSNGGMLPARLVTERPGSTLLSGPAAGVIACAQLASICGIDNVIGFDMGGTSADLAMLVGAQIPYSTETRIGDFPVIFPSVEVISVGAGGGSIARLDNLGVLKVGPQSAGADPGPVCYGRGGSAPTVTDAYVAAGILDPDNFLGGRVKLSPELATSSIAGLARGTRHTADELADGILKVATSNLMVGIGRVEAAKGIDIRDFTLLAYGGAGPTHACLLAETLGMHHIVIPLSPGTFCAWGSLLADFRLDYVKSVRQTARVVSWPDVRDWFAGHEQEGRSLLERETSLLRGVAALRSIDMRYQGQGFEVQVALTDELLASGDSERLADAFHARYRDVYGLADRAIPVDLINIRLTLVGQTTKLALQPLARTVAPPRAKPPRSVYLNGARHDVQVLWRHDLAVGQEIIGPCLIDQEDTTSFVRPGWVGRVDSYGILHLAESMADRHHARGSA